MAVRIPRTIQWREQVAARRQSIAAWACVSGLRLIVVGGSNYVDRAKVFAVLDAVHIDRGIREIIERGSAGADALARDWAAARGVMCTMIAADRTLGRRAAQCRNDVLLAMKPDGVIAFPGGRATAELVDRAVRAELIVWQPNVTLSTADRPPS